MFWIFKRKQKDEDLEDNELEQEAKQPVKRKRTPRPKSVPPKPWGKKERYWVGGFFLVTVLASGLLAISAREWKLPGVPRIKPPEVKIFEPERIVFVNEPEIDEAKTMLVEEAKNKFKEKTIELSGVFGFYIYDLNEGFGYGVNETEQFQAASLIKLPVMATLFKLEEDGKLNLEKEYTLKDDDKVAGAGSLYYEPEGTIITFRELIKLMGKQSDNTAFRIALNEIGQDDVEKFINSFGLINTRYETNLTTPHDMGRFLKNIWEAELINRENSESVLQYLTETSFESYLPAGIPDDIRVAHKYGRELHVINDAGIVYTPNPFVIVIMSKGIVEGEVDREFAQIAEILYENHLKVQND